MDGSVSTPGGGRLDAESYGSVHVVAVGKAAGLMSDEACGRLAVSGGVAVVPRGSRAAPGVMRTVEASHPEPDRSSMRAAEEVAAYLEGVDDSDLVLFLVSGGSSSLLCRPDGVTLEEKRQACRLLLESDASIGEVNCVRKHLSGIKGGRLVSGLRCDAVSLVMSDVPGDDLSAIASGITYCDDTTFGDALNVLDRHDAARAAPRSVYRHLRRGAAGMIPETPGRPRLPNAVVATNADCLAAMSGKASSLGYGPVTYCLPSDASRAVADLAAMAARGSGCIIFGGEVSIPVRGDGRGGRNQELPLRLAGALPGECGDLVVASMGTDGVDGNTEYAGAIMRLPGIDRGYVDGLLESSDSNSYFSRHGGLIYTGQTGTNLMDIGLVLAG